ncbi:Palmitoyltransferase akr1 [Elsinoe australis]|uniref:Palmitoyltransferase akr1 n=1 Tax=Elsinoe australis TaxID=40998 RepID=A0A2P7YL12_9PEZI|nr:Palmitoyltransferase akr1 [Elsinoe australis]
MLVENVVGVGGAVVGTIGEAVETLVVVVDGGGDGGDGGDVGAGPVDSTQYSTPGWRPLTQPSPTEGLSRVQETTDGQALINSKDSRGKTPLHYACRSGRAESVVLLLRAGADIVARDNGGHTPLWSCTEFEAEQQLWCGYRETGVEEEDYLEQCNRLDLAGQLYCAAGLTPTDETRPFVSACKEIDYMLGPVRDQGPRHEHDTTRIEEIFHLLMQRAKEIGLPEQELGLPDTLDVAQLDLDGHHYVAKSFCKLRFPDWTIAGMFYGSNQRSLNLLKAQSEALTAVRKSHCSYNAMLRQREFAALMEMFAPGTNNSLDLSDKRDFQFLALLTKFGYAELLRQASKVIRVNESPRRPDGRMRPAQMQSLQQHQLPLLYTACKRVLSNMDVVRILVEEMHVNVNEVVRGEPAGEDDGIKDETDDDSPQKFFTALHYLAAGRHWWQVTHCLPYILRLPGIDIDARNERQETPLHLAIISRHPYADISVGTLIEHGADLDAIDEEGQSCSTLLARRG